MPKNILIRWRLVVRASKLILTAYRRQVPSRLPEILQKVGIALTVSSCEFIVVPFMVRKI